MPRSLKELKRLTRELVDEGYLASFKFRSVKLSGGLSARSVHAELQNTIVRRKRFAGYGTWENYLTKVHGVSPFVHRRWPPEAFHSVICDLVKVHGEASTKWANSEKAYRTPGAHGRSLGALFIQAMRSKEKGLPFFGKGTWAAYIKWLKRRRPRKF